MFGFGKAAYDYDFISDYFTHNVPLWQEYLAKYAGRPRLTFLEIGSLEGRSAVWLLENILTDRSSVLHCVDLWEDPTIEATFDRNARIVKKRSKGRLVKHKGNSVDLLPALPPETMDAIYVDGSHLSKHVLSDLTFGWRLLRVGGMLICDDYPMRFEVPGADRAGAQAITDGPRVAIDAFLSCFERDCRVLYKEWQVLVEKTR